MTAYVEAPPGTEAEWRLPRSAREVADELELCAVPLDADPRRARVLLELNGVWARRPVVADALRWRLRMSSLSGQDT